MLSVPSLKLSLCPSQDKTVGSPVFVVGPSACRRATFKPESLSHSQNTPRVLKILCSPLTCVYEGA